MGWVIDIYLFDTSIVTADTNSFSSFSRSDSEKGFTWTHYNAQSNYYYYYSFLVTWGTDPDGEYGYPKLNFVFDALSQNTGASTFKLGVNITDVYTILDTDENWNGEFTPQFHPLIDDTFHHDAVYTTYTSVMTLEPPVPPIAFMTCYVNFHPMNFTFTMTAPPITDGQFRNAIYSLAPNENIEQTNQENSNYIRSRYGDGIPKPTLFEKK